jgi:hypothetical protein
MNTTSRPLAAALGLLVTLSLVAACSGPARPASETDSLNPPPGLDDSGGSAPGGQPGAGGGGQPVGPGDPDQPIGVVPGPGDGDPDPDGDGDGALRVEPEPGIINARPHAWDHITVAPDGRTLTVYYWGGVEACYGLAAVTAERDADGVLHVTVLEGQRGNLGNDVACIEIALLKAVTITLDAPIVAPIDQ